MRLWCTAFLIALAGGAAVLFGEQPPGAVPGRDVPGSTVVQTDAYYIQTLSDFGSHRRLVRVAGKPDIYAAFMTVGGSSGKLEYRWSSDLGTTWQNDRSTVIGPSLQCGISTWADEQDNIYVLYDDERNTATMCKLTREGDGKWKVGPRGNAGQSLAQYRAYMHSAICKEPGKDGKLWACWWEHGKDGAAQGTIKRLRVARSSDADGVGKWSEPVDPIPANVPVYENETLGCTFVLLEGKPALFVYQGFYGRTGLSRWNGKEWKFEELNLKAGLNKSDHSAYTTHSIATDSQGTLHLAWNALSQEGGVFYKQYKGGKWSDTVAVSSNSQDRWPTITMVDGQTPALLWCRPLKEAKNYQVAHQVVGAVMREGKWDAKAKVLVNDENPQADMSIMFPNTAVASGKKVVFIYSYGGFEAGGKRVLKSAVWDTEVP